MLRLDSMQFFNSCARDVMSSSGTFSFSSAIFFSKDCKQSFVRFVSSKFFCTSFFKIFKSFFNFSILPEFSCNIVRISIRFSFSFSSGLLVAPTCVVTSDLLPEHLVNDSQFSSSPIPSIRIDPDSFLSSS